MKTVEFILRNSGKYTCTEDTKRGDNHSGRYVPAEVAERLLAALKAFPGIHASEDSPIAQWVAKVNQAIKQADEG